MITVAFDTETSRIEKGLQAPPLACLTYQIQGRKAEIVDYRDALDAMYDFVCTRGFLLTGHEVSFDMCIMCNEYPELYPYVFKAYMDDRVTCTRIREQLSDIALGQFRGKLGPDDVWIKYGYSLAELSERHFGRKLDKTTYREGYGPLREVPLDQWEKGAREYALEDARATLMLHEFQQPNPDEFRQARFAFAARLSSNYGICTDPVGVAGFKKAVQEEYDDLRETMLEYKLLRPNGVRDLKEVSRVMVQVCTELGIPVVRTDKGNVSLAREACEAVDDPVIQDYSKFLTLGKVLSNDIKVVEDGTLAPLHPQYNMADSGRTTCRNPNIQNLNRKTGIREAFVPRKGFVFAQADYGSLELATLAQVCLTLLGESKLAESLNAGLDPHTEFACKLLGCTYDVGMAWKEDKSDKVFDNARQTAKVANFGFPGGLGAKSLVKFAKRNYGVTLSVYRAEMLREQWFQQWPEMRKFFYHVSRACSGKGQTCDIVQLFSGRIRGKVRYTAACNTLFQGLGADIAKNAVWLVTEACYNQPASPLFGCRIVAFIHDELILEVPDTPIRDAAARELECLMVLASRPFLPDVRIDAKPLLMRRWSKNAKALYDNNGVLIPWE